METSLLKMVNDILLGMENQKITTVVILDLSAVFDTFNHDYPPHCTQESLWHRWDEIKWFENYLKPRYFIVCIDGHYSSLNELKFSIPQGSHSGANIFICYCTLISHIIPDTITINGFVDGPLNQREI